MVVCKFFLQGTCKFGNSCRFEHQLNDSSKGSSILRQAIQNPASADAMDQNTIIRCIVTDMTSAEQGRQWVFSSYSPFKDKPSFPGFEDKSFDEIRWGFHEATRNGTVEQYKQTVQLWYQEALGKIKMLQNPTEDIVKILMQIYNTPTTNPNSVFQNNTGNSPFAAQTPFGGNSQNTASIFGGNNSQGTSVFKTSQSNSAFRQKSIFGGNSNNSPFSNNQSIFGKPAVNTSTSIFGQSNVKNLLQSSSANPTNSIFTQNNVNPTNNIFTQNSGASIFGQNNYGANHSTQSNIFGQNTVFNSNQNQQSPFGSQNNPAPFGTPATQPNVLVNTTTPFGPQPTQPNIGVNPSNQVNQSSPFRNPSQPTPFVNPVSNNQTNTQPIFGKPQMQISQPSNTPLQTNTNSIFLPSAPALSNNQTSNIQGNIQSVPVSQPSQSIFGQNPMFSNTASNKNSSIFGGQERSRTEANDEKWYSNLEELTQEEIRSFESEQFEFGKIPEKPPTLQMCF